VQDDILMLQLNESTERIELGQPVVTLDHHVSKLIWEVVGNIYGLHKEMVIIAADNLLIYSFDRSNETPSMKLLAVYCPKKHLPSIKHSICILDACLHPQTSIIYFITNHKSIGCIRVDWDGNVKYTKEFRISFMPLTIGSIEDSYQVISLDTEGCINETWSNIAIIKPSERLAKLDVPC